MCFDFFNNNTMDIKKTCNKIFFDRLQSEMDNYWKGVRRNPEKRKRPADMKNTFEVVTEDPYDELLGNLISAMKKALHNASDIKQIEEVVCDLYKNFITDLKLALLKKKVKVKEGGTYKTPQISIDFNDQFDKLKKGFNKKMRTEFPNKNTRREMRQKLKRRMRDIFTSQRKP